MFTGESGSLHIELLSSGFDKHAHIFLIYTCTIALLRPRLIFCLAGHAMQAAKHHPALPLMHFIP
jgi:hypothetical protein